jgi:CRISPR-associated endonuclease/helicase Cas3
MSAPYLQFWGKAQGEREGEPHWHPVAYHNLDVAAVADVLLRHNPKRLDGLARLLRATPAATRTFVVAMIALHDIGKFAAAFQAKVPEFYPPSPCLSPWTGSSAVRHDLIGSELRKSVRSALASHMAAWDASDFAALWHSVSGHHGLPRIAEHRDIPAAMTRAGMTALQAYMQDCTALFPVPDPIAQPALLSLAQLSWTVAGLTVIADWIGSNRDWFPYRKPDQTLADYWAYALAQAETAVAKAGIQPTTLAPAVSPQYLLPAIATNLSPLQQFAADIALPDGPTLAIIEDVTGSGKTEAALLLAARLMQAGQADGIFFALPTMATANAMYERLSDIYRRLFAADAKPSLVLAHGRQALHEQFQGTILTSRPEPPVLGANTGENNGDESSATCAAWIADSRRKVFLAHVGVGTIDQALLGVLPSKFQALRLWGLASRVLVIDEAHAYDAYMSKEIEALLEFHGSLGGSAVILSATLPQAQRRGLAAAFARGLGSNAKTPKLPDVIAYPLVTMVSASGAAAHPVDTRLDRHRVLPVRRIASVNDAIGHVADMAGKGAAVAWIRNTVDDAIEAVEALRQRGLAPVLLHARFAMGDRLAIETGLTATLGREDKTGRRAGYIVVGTQILEQSLDYDVDAMITDLAPIDLMIQRAGRLWRHTGRTSRPVASPELLVLSPDPADVRDHKWYGQISERAAFVYGHHGIVWRSAKVLFETGHITTPGGVRDLIERVYGHLPTEFGDVPEQLWRQSQQAVGKTSAERSIAKANLLQLDAGYGGAANQLNWSKDTITPTRLGQPVTVFRLGRISNGRVVPLCEGATGRIAWALSEVSIASAKANAVPEPVPEHAAMIAATKLSWPPWERDGQPLLILEPDGGGWKGMAAKTGARPGSRSPNGDKPVRYDDQLGFRIIDA